MKKLTLLLTLTLAFAGSPSLFAADAKKKADAAPATTKTADAKPADAKAPAAPKAARPLMMNATVDEIDATAKTFTHNNVDGKKVKFVVTDKTEIKQGDAAAKFEDIKVGDTVAGLRTKTSDTEYAVVKITKFGPAPAKKGDATKKADEPKKKAAK